MSRCFSRLRKSWKVIPFPVYIRQKMGFILVGTTSRPGAVAVSIFLVLYLNAQITDLRIFRDQITISFSAKALDRTFNGRGSRRFWQSARWTSMVIKLNSGYCWPLGLNAWELFLASIQNLCNYSFEKLVWRLALRNGAMNTLRLHEHQTAVLNDIHKPSKLSTILEFVLSWVSATSVQIIFFMLP